MAQTLQQFTEQVHKSLSPVYLLHGEETFLIDRLIKTILHSALEPGSEDFNLDILHGGDVDGAKIVNTAMAYPMMAPRRVVIVKNIHLLSEKSLELIAKYVQKPSQSTTLLLTAGKLDMRRSVFAQIRRRAAEFEAKPLYDNQIPAWTKNYLTERNITISETALHLLHVSVGNSLQNISKEIEKIELNLGDRKHIDIRDVETVVGVSRHFNVFEFCDAVGQRDIKKGLSILNHMMQIGESPGGLTAMLNRHFQILAKLREMKSSDVPFQEMTRNLHLPPFIIKNYLGQINRYSSGQLKTAFSYLLEADEQLKTSYQKPKIILESLLFKLYRL